MKAMPKRTLAALKASIVKWEGNVAAKTPGQVLLGPESCPLCALFFVGDCHGCPVRQFTGDRDCCGSPYDEALDAWDAWDNEPTIQKYKTAWREAARAELNFLVSLLPEGER